MSSVPEYTPERAYMFARQRNTVRAKIEKLFDLQQVSSEEELKKQYGKRVDATFSKTDWKLRSADCAQHSGMEWNEQKQSQLDAIAKTTFFRILDGDQMLLAVSDKHTHKQKDGSGYFRGESLVEIYLNHVMREGISQIKSMGFSDRSAVSLGGQLVKKLPGFVEEVGAIKPLYNKKASVEANVDRIYNHWKHMRDILNDDHEMNAPDLFADKQRSS